MKEDKQMAIMSQNNWREPTEAMITGIKNQKRRLIEQRLTSPKSKTLREGNAMERLNWALSDYELHSHTGERLLTDAELRRLLRFPSEEVKQEFDFYNKLFVIFSDVEPYVVLAYSSYQVDADALIHHTSLHEEKLKAQMERCSILTAMRTGLKTTSLPEEVIQKMIDGVMESAPLKGEEFVWDEEMQHYVGTYGGGFPTSGSILGYAREKSKQIKNRLAAFKGYAVAVDDTLKEYGLPRTFLPLMVRACIEEMENEKHLDFMHVDRQYRQSYINDIKKEKGEAWEIYEEQKRIAEENGQTLKSMAFHPDYREIKKDEEIYKAVKKSLIFKA